MSGDIGDLKRLKLLKEMHLRGTNVTGDIQVRSGFGSRRRRGLRILWSKDSCWGSWMVIDPLWEIRQALEDRGAHKEFD